MPSVFRHTFLRDSQPKESDFADKTKFQILQYHSVLPTKVRNSPCKKIVLPSFLRAKKKMCTISYNEPLSCLSAKVPERSEPEIHNNSNQIKLDSACEEELNEQAINLLKISLYHQYNTVRDAAETLLGQIAEYQGIPLKDVHSNFSCD